MKRYFALFAALLVLGGCLSSCEKKNEDLQTIPGLLDDGLPEGMDTLIAGDTVRIHPLLEDSLQARYQWLLNGEPVSTASSFRFSPAERGAYTITYKVSNTAGELTQEYLIYALGTYENGLFIVNEGWFGHEPGSVIYYPYGADTVQEWAFKKANEGKELGVTTQFAAIFNETLYLVSKQPWNGSGSLVAADAYSLKETGRIDQLPADGRAFLAVDASSGLISTQDGVYRVNLDPLTVGDKVEGISGQCGALLKQGDHIFVISQSQGIVILDAADYGIEKTHAKGSIGFVTSKDGDVWAAGGQQLIRIDAETLEISEVDLPFPVSDSWGSWRAGSITASTAENAVYIAPRGFMETGGTEIYRYVPGEDASLSAPFITLPDGQFFYGAAMRYNPGRNELVATTLPNVWSSDDNGLLIFDAATGGLKNTVRYQGWHFAALPVCHSSQDED